MAAKRSKKVGFSRTDASAFLCSWPCSAKVGLESNGQYIRQESYILLLRTLTLTLNYPRMDRIIDVLTLYAINTGAYSLLSEKLVANAFALGLLTRWDSYIFRPVLLN